MILNLGIPHRGLELYKVCINNDHRLTPIHFTERSNLVAHAANDHIDSIFKVLKKKTPERFLPLP